MMEYKNLPQFVESIEGRMVTGIFAVHGNVDDGGDMSINGSFGKRLGDGDRKRVRFLWNHDSWSPPIASIKSVREVDRGGLPEKVLAWAPDASGGVEVVREYYEGIPLADWVLKAISAGDVTEMSYAYDIHESRMEKMGADDRMIRIIEDVELFDISDVNWGMNSATAGVKGLPVAGMTFTQHSAWVVSTLGEYMERVKDRKDFRESEGRRLSEPIMAGLRELAAGMEKLVAGGGPSICPKTGVTQDAMGGGDLLELEAMATRLKIRLMEV